MKQIVVSLLLLWNSDLLANTNALQEINAFHRQNQVVNETQEGQYSSVRPCKKVNTADIVVVKNSRNVPGQGGEDDIRLYCLQRERTQAECSAARQGVIVNVATDEETQKIVAGELIVEMTNVTIMENNEEAIVREIHSILVHEITPAFIGCKNNHSESFNIATTELTYNTSDSSSSRIQVSWINFGAITLERECTGTGRNNETKPSDCIKIATTFDILYQGTVAERSQEEEEMVALLLETIHQQVIRGQFDSLGNVYSLETRNAALHKSASHRFVSRGSPGFPLVAVLGILLAILFLAMLLCYCRKNHKVRSKTVPDDLRQKRKIQTNGQSPECEATKSNLPCYMQPTVKDDASVVEDSAEAISCLPNCCYPFETTNYSY